MLSINDFKDCRKCRVKKPLTQFYKWKYGKDGRQIYCIECRVPISRAAKLMERYHMTLEDYNQIFEQQQGCCYVCKRHQSELTKALRVDHNHSTGNIRALLCDQCNTAIGLFHEDTERLENAVKYLKGTL